MALRLLVVALATTTIVMISVAQTTTYNQASQSAIASSLSSECVGYISEYPPTIATYASSICQVCQGLSISPSIEPCCSAGNPTACFASSFYGVSVSDATVSSTITEPADFSSCLSAVMVATSCEAATPGFDNLCFHDQQSCLCSTSGTWAPSYYDNFWSGCLGYLSTADPSSYSLLGPNSNGVVQSRKCQTWYELTSTGGTPSNCMTSPAPSLSSASSLAPIGHSSPTVASASSTTPAVQTSPAATSSAAANKMIIIPANIVVVVISVVKVIAMN